MCSLFFTHPRPYCYFEPARYEGTNIFACRRRTETYDQFGDIIDTAFLQPSIQQIYERHKSRSQLLGAALLVAWVSELLVHSLFYYIEQTTSGRHSRFRETPAQETSTDSHLITRNPDLRDHQDGLAQGTHNNTDPLPLHVNTHSHHDSGSDGETPPPDKQPITRSFDQYGPLKTVSEINEGIKQLLLGSCPATAGYIYGFMHPNDLASQPSAGISRGPKLIKIGRSIDYERRMREIGRKCEYVPNVVFAYHMPHHVRVELVVHLQLHNTRLRDVGCSGCGVRHEEWFQVDIEHAERLVGLWQSFANCRPYDEQGEMLLMWRERLEGLDLDDIDCWERFIQGASSDSPLAEYPLEIDGYPRTSESEGGSSSD